MTWNALRNPLDYIVLAGKPSPGLCEVQGADSSRKWDERKPYAHSGSTLVFRGVELARFTVKLWLYNDQDWDDWNAWRPLVDAVPVGTGPNKESKFQDIVHPILADQRITKACVQRVGQPYQIDDGVWEIELAFIEGRDPMPALAKPKGSKAQASQPKVDPIEQRIQQLDQQYKDLAAQ